MDDRVRALLDNFPRIFERTAFKEIDLEGDWVIIDSTGGNDDQPEFDIDILEDLDRFIGDDLPETTSDEPSIAWPLLPIDLYPPDVSDEDRRILIELLRERRDDHMEKLRRKIKGEFAGGPAPISPKELPPPDALAVYLPFHRYPDLWGIYLLDSAVAQFAQCLGNICRKKGHPVSPIDARNAAVAYLYHHEAYHSAAEGFALRCELPRRRPVYKTGMRRLFQWHPPTPHEETLATAYGLRKIRDNLQLPKNAKEALLKALETYLMGCSPPYQEGVKYQDDDRFTALELAFKELVIRKCGAGAIDPSCWELGTYLMTPLLQRNRKFSWLCDRKDFRKRSKLAVHYFRRRDVIACLRRIAGAREEEGGKHKHLVVEKALPDGSHSKFRTQVPSGEIKRGTLSAMLKDLKLDLNVEAFRDSCRKAGNAV